MLNAYSAGISLYLKYKQELERILAMNITKNALVVILSFVLLVSLTVNVMASEDVNPEDRYNKYSESCNYDTDSHQDSTRGNGNGCIIHGEEGVIYEWTGQTRILGNEVQQLWKCTCVECNRTWYEWF